MAYKLLLTNSFNNDLSSIIDYIINKLCNKTVYSGKDKPADRR